MGTKLTPKQEKFALAYIELGDASKAYRAVYRTEGMPDKKIWQKSSELKAKPRVGGRIDELQAEHAGRHNITVDNLTDKLLNIYKIAMVEDKPEEEDEKDEDDKTPVRLKNLKCAYLAVMGLAKIHGLDKLTVELSAPGGSPLLQPNFVVRFVKPGKKGKKNAAKTTKNIGKS